MTLHRTLLTLSLLVGTLVACGPKDADDDGYPEGVDCDDENAAVNPGADDICDGVDNDCSGEVDDRPIDGTVYYADADGDGYGDALAPTLACEAPANTATEAGDCDDSDAAYNPGATEDDCTDTNDYNCDGSVGYADGDGDGFFACEECDDGDDDVNPNATEVCDGEDNDCDGDVDDADDSLDTTTGLTFYADTDGDGFGDLDTIVQACALPVGASLNADDCDDTNDAINPSAPEVCDAGTDNDCDGEVDEPDAVDAPTWNADWDGDGVGSSVTQRACTQPAGFVDTRGDCDDLNATAYPGATEVCDGGTDNDCDGAADDEDTSLDTSTQTTWYLDSDGDGAGDEDTTLAACEQPTGYVSNDLDCYDSDSSLIHCLCGDASDGSFTAPTGSSSIAGGTYNYSSFTVPSGATLTVTGSDPLIILATSIDVSGTIDVSGGDGLDSGPSAGPDGGDATGGGGGGGGGGDCGNGNGDGGSPGGGTPSGTSTDGGVGGRAVDTTASQATGGGYGPGGGGGGGGSSATGSNGDRTSGSDGLGGGSFGSATLESLFTGGGGGAGGGANGGGGGAGGGAVALFGSVVDISGTVDVRGGDGGSKTSGSCTSGGGGGGGGGMIWVHGDDVDVTGDLFADGGTGHPVVSSVSLNAAGGDGADGRIRVSGPTRSVTGSVSPTAYADSTSPDCDRW